MSVSSTPDNMPSAASPTDESVRFVRQVREIVKDLIVPDARIYWFDMLVTITVAQLCFAVYAESTLWSPTFWVSYLVAGIAFYRATVFSHEIAHFRDGTFKAFRLVWNIFCGVPLMFPEFLYEDHKAHHVNHSYGTAEDGEYLPFGRNPISMIVRYVLQVFLVPVAGVFRFMVLAPLSWCIPSMRPWVLGRTTNAVSIALNYQLPIPKDPAHLRLWKLQEVACFVYGAGVFTLIGFGVLPWTILVRIYFLFLFSSGLNYARTLGAHRYLSQGGAATYLEQLLDSYTIPGNPVLTEIWAPLGMRYHALHHLVPSMPYHNMGKAHRRLIRDLPEDSPYRDTIRGNLRQAVLEVVRNAWNSERRTVTA